MKNLPSYDSYRLLESAGPLASSFKKAGFEDMTRNDFEGFSGVQDGGLMYTGKDFIALYGLAADDSKPVVCVMYGDDPFDQIEAHILNQSEQKAFVSKLPSFSKEMDRLCALGAGAEKTDGIKAWLRKFGFQVISGPVMNEDTATGLLGKPLKKRLLSEEWDFWKTKFNLRDQPDLVMDQFVRTMIGLGHSQPEIDSFFSGLSK